MNQMNQSATSIFNVEKVEHLVHHGAGYYSGSSNDYYNLIVYGCEPWFKKQNHITITRDRALMEDYYIDAELKARYSSLSNSAIAELLTFPSIFAYENTHGRRTDPGHEAAVGHLTNIKKRSNGIEIYFRPIFFVDQQRLNELSFELGIMGSSRGIHELSRSHWTVKAIDLYEVLRDNEILMR